MIIIYYLYMINYLLFIKPNKKVHSYLLRNLICSPSIIIIIKK